MSSNVNRSARRARATGGGDILSTWCTVGAAAFVSAFAGLFSVAVHAQQARRVTDGVYTSTQATRGQAVYKDRCATCHGATLSGAQAPPLVGDDFIRTWSGPVSELANKIQNTMPANDPGKLTRQQAADILAYMLQVGKFPAGQAELGADEAALKQITFPARPRPSLERGGRRGGAPCFPPAGNMAQVMRGILFPSSNLIFNVQGHDPAAPLDARRRARRPQGRFPGPTGAPAFTPDGNWWTTPPWRSLNPPR